MFEALRKMIFPIIIIVLLLFVAMIILEWGRGFSSRQRYATANLAAVINGEEIPWETYNRIYNNMYQSEVTRTEEEVSDAKIKEIQQGAWAQLLHDRLISQQVLKNNIVVTDDELYGYLRMSPPKDLQQMPYFQTDGKFDYQKYMNALADPQASNFWASLEPALRADIAKLKVQEMVVQTAIVTEPEVRAAWVADQEKIKVGVVNVPQGKYRGKLPQAADDELRRYYTDHKDRYFSDERAVLEYVIIRSAATDYDWEQVRSHLQTIRDSIAAGADFAAMAKEYSEDANAASGGDLGTFARGQMVPQFDSMAFALKDGDLSQPFRTDFGWHIIKHHGYTGGQAHVSHILLKVRPSQKTLDDIFNKLEAFRSTAQEKGFAAAAQEMSLTPRKTRPFHKGQATQEFGQDQALNRFAFEGKINDITDVRVSQNGSYVARIAERYPKGIASFEEIRSQVEQEWRRDRLTAICRDTAQAIYELIQRGTAIESAAQKYGTAYTVEAEFNRGGMIPSIGSDPRAIGGAFSLTVPGMVSKPVDYEMGCAIFKLVERSSVDLTGYNEKRDSVSNALLGAKQQQLYARWYENLVASSQVINNIDQIRTSDTL